MNSAIAARVVTPTFANACRLWCWTVRCEIDSARAISLSVRPWAMSRHDLARRADAPGGEEHRREFGGGDDARGTRDRVAAQALGQAVTVPALEGLVQRALRAGPEAQPRCHPHRNLAAATEGDRGDDRRLRDHTRHGHGSLERSLARGDASHQGGYRGERRPAVQGTQAAAEGQLVAGDACLLVGHRGAAHVTQQRRVEDLAQLHVVGAEFPGDPDGDRAGAQRALGRQRRARVGGQCERSRQLGEPQGGG